MLQWCGEGVAISYLIVSGIYVQEIKKLSDSTISEHDKEDKMMEYEEEIRTYKSYIADYEDEIMSMERALGGRGESNI